jgi:hypothetical protein
MVLFVPEMVVRRPPMAAYREVRVIGSAPEFRQPMRGAYISREDFRFAGFHTAYQTRAAENGRALSRIGPRPS